jgi:hypothetical protein
LLRQLVDEWLGLSSMRNATLSVVVATQQVIGGFASRLLHRLPGEHLIHGSNP